MRIERDQEEQAIGKPQGTSSHIRRSFFPTKTKTKTNTKTKTKCIEDPTYAIFSKSRQFKDINYDQTRPFFIILLEGHQTYSVYLATI